MYWRLGVLQYSASLPNTGPLGILVVGRIGIDVDVLQYFVPLRVRQRFVILFASLRQPLPNLLGVILVCAEWFLLRYNLAISLREPLVALF